MSRYGDGDYEEDFPNQGAFWIHSARLALAGKRGKKALAELREALLHLPEKRLIERALCTVDPEKRRPEVIHRPDGSVSDWWGKDFEEIVAEQGEGVCAVGAYLWWQEVKAGKDPRTAFAALPTLSDTEADIHETAYEGQKAGLTYSLAWELAYRNDEAFEGMTPEERYDAFLAWIDKQLATPTPRRGVALSAVGGTDG